MMCNLESIIQYFGYPAIVIGTFFEGETILVLGGFAAHRGYLCLPLVIACAFWGSFIGDQLFFFIGRKRGLSYFDKKPRIKDKIYRLQAMLTKYNTLLILSFRFLYGLRTIVPFAIGLSSISVKRFFILNAISAVIWAVVIGTLGFFFGHAFEMLLEDVKKYEAWILAAGLVLLALRVLYHFLYKRKQY